MENQPSNGGSPVGGAATGSVTDSAGRSNIIRRAYDWILSWAHTPYGGIALAVLAFAESSFFPIPPDALLMALVISARKKAFRFALICTVFSVLGGIFGYYIGSGLYDLIGTKIIGYYNYQVKFDRLCELFNSHGFISVFVAALTPIPYKVFTIASGVSGMDIPTFLAASIVGRGARFFAVSGLLYVFGDPVGKFIDRYFNLLTIVFVLLLVLGFLAVKYMAPLMS